MFYFFYCTEVDQVLPVKPEELFRRQHSMDLVKRLIDHIFLVIEAPDNSCLMLYVKESDGVGRDIDILILFEDKEILFPCRGRSSDLCQQVI
jgi:hypothetical protein